MMNLREFTKIAVLGLLFSGVGFSTRAATNLPSVIVYTTGGRALPGKGESYDQVAVAAWPDGRIVWSTNQIEGGAPFKQGKFPPEKLNGLLKKLETAGAFTNKDLTYIRFGPDARYNCIVVRDGKRNLKLQSWHELFEQHTNLIVTASGVSSLEGRNREAVQREQPADYREFRKTWTEIRQALVALIPKSGEPFDGKVPIPE